MDAESLLGRQKSIFHKDISESQSQLREAISGKRCLVIGAAGSIGKAVSKELWSLSPEALHLVDLSENNLVEVVRDIRSSEHQSSCDLRSFAIDVGSVEFRSLCRGSGIYDFIFNLSALKHVRSESNPYTLMRMIQVNIFNTIGVLQHCQLSQDGSYFVVSTDKAANPVNMMGASKRIMELFLMRASQNANIKMARFANVAFSDGSLLHGLNQRFLMQQPLSAPNDIKRFFITPRESGQLCLMAAVLGKNNEIFFPKFNAEEHALGFLEICEKFLLSKGFTPVHCDSEEDARKLAEQLISKKKWPCYFFDSDTTGEKSIEEFFMSDEPVDFERFVDLGVVMNKRTVNSSELDRFEADVKLLRDKESWSKEELVILFQRLLPEFMHKELGRYLDEKM